MCTFLKYCTETYNSSSPRLNTLRAVRSLQDGPSHPKVKFLESKKCWDAESTGYVLQPDSFLPDNCQQEKNTYSSELEDSLTNLTLLLSTVRRKTCWTLKPIWSFDIGIYQLHVLSQAACKPVCYIKMIWWWILIPEAKFDSQKKWIVKKESSHRNKKTSYTYSNKSWSFRMESFAFFCLSSGGKYFRRVSA